MIKNLLCVDDDDIAQFYTHSIIEDADFIENSLSVFDGQKAIDFFEQLLKNNHLTNIPELVLLDINMPIMDGWEFLQVFSRKFRPEFQDVKIAIVSSSVNPADFEKAKEYPFVIDFISKPITADILKLIDERYFSGIDVPAINT